MHACLPLILEKTILMQHVTNMQKKYLKIKILYCNFLPDLTISFVYMKIYVCINEFVKFNLSSFTATAIRTNTLKIPKKE